MNNHSYQNQYQVNPTLDDASPSKPSFKNNRESRRSQDHRRFIGKAVTAERKKELDVKLFADHGGLEGFSNTLKLTPQNRSIILPVSTRGIGFVLNETCLQIALVQPTLQIPIPELYRTALAIAEAKISLSNDEQTEFSLAEPIPRTRMPVDMLNVVKSFPRHLNTITSIINTFGNVTVTENTFSPRFGENRFTSLRLSNLRQYVEAMSDPATPLHDRQVAAALNSIPSAVFEIASVPAVVLVNGVHVPAYVRGDQAYPVDNHNPQGLIEDPATLRLVNPDYIIVEDYNITDLVRDFNVVKAFLARLEKKGAKYIGTVQFVPTGLASILVSSTMPQLHNMHLASCRRNEQVEYRHIIGDHSEWYSIRSLPTSTFLMGIIAVSGEVHHTQPANVIAPQQCVRSQYTGTQVMDLSWSQTIASML